MARGVQKVGERNRGNWTANSLVYLANVDTVLAELRGYWPLTLRQVYYRLVASLLIDNTKQEYKKLSQILARARLSGFVSWDAIEDRVRSTLDSSGWSDSEEFVEFELSELLTGYRRDLLQSQDTAIEVWVEKDALSRICHRAAFPFCVPVVVARGFSSVSYLHKCRTRVERNRAKGKKTTILYFGDLDPSGWEMLPSMMYTLKEEMELGTNVRGARCALNPDQVAEYDLPRSIDAMKMTDSRTPKFRRMLKEAGFDDTLAVELDALPPATLEALVTDSIEAELDMSILREERNKELQEQSKLKVLRADVDSDVREKTGLGEKGPVG
jgi:hypothetical protein